VRELEIAVYVRRRILAALLGAAVPGDPPGVLRPLLAGLLVSVLVAAGVVGWRTW
jgi:hypothetical protein